jgi:hypothetical protein
MMRLLAVPQALQAEVLARILFFYRELRKCHTKSN